jgi:S1-C subfamily serine protease
LGVIYQDIASLTIDEKKKIGLSETLDYGALIIDEDLAKEINNPFFDASDPKNGIFPDSPAEKAGLKADDIILEINGEKVAAPFYKAIDKYAPGNKVNLKILRDGKEINIDLIFAEMPEL